MKTLSLSASVALAMTSVLFAERHPYERYESIVERQMFGRLPEGFDPTKPPSAVQKASAKPEKELTKEQEKIKSAIRFSLINVTPSGETAVGFTDSSDAKNPKHYYLKVGEIRDGWEVKAADPLKATMTIAKDDITLDLSLGGNSAQGAGTAKRAETPAASGRRGLFGGGARPAGSLRSRLLEKREMRAADEKAAAEERAKREQEAAAEKAKAEEEKAQRDAEREQQRLQLQQIQDELKKAREARAATAAAAAEAEKADAPAEE